MPDGVVRPTIGARVVVPLGTRVVTGIVVEVDVPLPACAQANARRTASAGPRPKSGDRRDGSPRAFVPPESSRSRAARESQRRRHTIPSLLPPMARAGEPMAQETRYAAITLMFGGARGVVEPRAHGKQRTRWTLRGRRHTRHPGLARAGSTDASSRRCALSIQLRPDASTQALSRPGGSHRSGLASGGSRYHSVAVVGSRFEQWPPVARRCRGSPPRSTPSSRRPPAGSGRALHAARSGRPRSTSAVVGGARADPRLSSCRDRADARPRSGSRSLRRAVRIHTGLSTASANQWQRIRRREIDVGSARARPSCAAEHVVAIVGRGARRSYKQGIARATRARLRDRPRQRPAALVVSSATPSMLPTPTPSAVTPGVVLDRLRARRPLAAVTVSPCAKSTPAEGPDLIRRDLRRGHPARLDRREHRCALTARLCYRVFAASARTIDCPNCSVSRGATSSDRRSARAVATATTRARARRSARSVRPVSRGGFVTSGRGRSGAWRSPVPGARIDRDAIAVKALSRCEPVSRLRDRGSRHESDRQGHDFPVRCSRGPRPISASDSPYLSASGGVHC